MESSVDQKPKPEKSKEEEKEDKQLDQELAFVKSLMKGQRACDDDKSVTDLEDLEASEFLNELLADQTSV